MEGKDQGGYNYMGLDQMSTTNSIERIFIEFLNGKLSENERHYLDFVQGYVYMEPWLFHLADEPFILIKVGQPISNHSKSILHAPIAALLLEDQEEFQFPDTWVNQCRNFSLIFKATLLHSKLLMQRQ
jgi:hypothetical protein